MELPATVTTKAKCNFAHLVTYPLSRLEQLVMSAGWRLVSRRVVDSELTQSRHKLGLCHLIGARLEPTDCRGGQIGKPYHWATVSCRVLPVTLPTPSLSPSSEPLAAAV